MTKVRSRDSLKNFHSLSVEGAKAELEHRSGKAKGLGTLQQYIYTTTTLKVLNKIFLIDTLYRDSEIHLCALAAPGRRAYIARASSCGKYMASTIPC